MSYNINKIEVSSEDDELYPQPEEVQFEGKFDRLNRVEKKSTFAQRFVVEKANFNIRNQPLGMVNFGSNSQSNSIRNSPRNNNQNTNNNHNQKK